MPVPRMETSLRIVGTASSAAPVVVPRDLDIGVIYTGEHDLMLPLLSTMKASADNLRYRLLLVDNATRHGVDAWRPIIRDTAVLTNQRRLGYAANLNRILSAADARYVLLMNTDMFFDPRQNCLSRMVKFMDVHGDCGVAGCRILHPDGRDARAARRFQTAAVLLARRFGMGRLMQRTLDRYFYLDHAGRVVRQPLALGLFPHAPQAGRRRGRTVRRDVRQIF